MSGLTLPTIREAIKAQLAANISRDVTVAAYPPGPASGPSIVIRPASDYLDYWLTFGSAGLTAARFELLVDPAGSDLESSARRLDDFLSAGSGNTSSILDALLVDSTLGLTGATSIVTGVVADADTSTAVVSVEVSVQKVRSVA